MGAPPGVTTVYVQDGAPIITPVVGVSAVVTPVVFGERPAIIVCPYCRVQGLTQIDYEPGACTWLSVGGCVLCGLWLGCCLIPLCVDGLKDVVHYCGTCHHQVGKYRRL